MFVEFTCHIFFIISYIYLNLDNLREFINVKLYTTYMKKKIEKKI